VSATAHDPDPAPNPFAPSLTLAACPVTILGSGVAFPPHPTDNATLLTRLMPDLPPDRRDALLAHLENELGVTSRAHLGPDVDPLTLAIAASCAALSEAQSQSPRRSPVPVAAILLATSTASRWTTAESARLAAALGLAVAFCDLRSGCTGGLWALIEGARLARDIAAPVLVVGCDSFSRAFPPGERMLPFAMGDGAGAIVLAPPTSSDSSEGLLGAVIGGQPAHVDLATVRAHLPPRTPAEPFVLGGDPEPFARAAEAALTASIDSLDSLDSLDALDSIDSIASIASAPIPGSSVLVPHVSRLGTARRLAAHAGLPFFAAGFSGHGNLGAASLLVAMHLLRKESLRSPGSVAEHVLLASAGGGLSFGAAWWRLPAFRSAHETR